MGTPKRRRGLVIVLVILAVLLLGAGAFAASFVWAPLDDAPVVAKRPAPARSVAFQGYKGSQKIALNVTRIAHSSVLLEVANIAVLTDPWFSERWHYHHGEPLGRSIADLPKLDAVVVSHEHYDHFDMKTFAKYPHRDVPIFLPASMVQAARDAGFTNVKGLEPWQAAKAGEAETLTITAAPGKHAEGVPELTYVIQAHGFTVYFGGDTLMIPELRQVADKFTKIDLVLLPINGLKVMDEQVVMNAEEAGTLVGWLKPRVAVPIHYRFHGSWFTDKFVLKYSGSTEQFQGAAQAANPKTLVRVLEPGQLLSIVRVPPEDKEKEEGAEAVDETGEPPAAEPAPAPGGTPAAPGSAAPAEPSP